MDPTVGARVRKARKKSALTQVELAKRAGIEQSTLSKLERGAGARADTMAKIAKAMGISSDELLFGRRIAAGR